MCGFYGTNIEVDQHKIDPLISRRGPDDHKVAEFDGFHVTHHLLRLDEHSEPQPYTSEDCLVVFNGELYNDNIDIPESEYITLGYKKSGTEFFKTLDGEFAIVLIDRKNKLSFVVTDDFRTKPIFYSIDSGFSFASYESYLKDIGVGDIVEPNCGEIVTIDLEKLEIQKVEKLYEFDTSQTKDSFDDWLSAFENAVRKRVDPKKGEGIFIGLSSGYDSGAIAHEAFKQGVSFNTYTVMGTETPHVIENRVRKYQSDNVNCKGWYKQPQLEQSAIGYIRQFTENKNYDITSSVGDYVETTRMDEDNGCKWLVTVCHTALQDGKRIILSGMGADEIFSDYGFDGNRMYAHSNFGGKYPEDLSEIFPWNSFYGSSMKSYIMKEEYVGGSFGIETRYPFLDRKVVQEFLWLKPELKNSKYKSVLYEYLTRNFVPFEESVKKGF